ncbi:protein kinase [Archangium violaceum]|uniref:protein kinase domain-containing protein n=1 Tax=Archangium violaceum TaxID=83451 RepID=UPI00193B3892|nr:protein kinase [Archangium violaceum]QRK06366.1 protein kinase [Archangium violaceum]
MSERPSGTVAGDAIRAGLSPSYPLGESMTRRDEDGHESGEGSSDFGDSFLREIVEFSPVPSPPEPGTRLGGRDGGRFEILGRLGKGGMGLVVRARDEVLRRVVALKFISPGREFNRETLDRLLQEEARLVAQLDHENIVRIFDVSEWKGAPFIIMECLSGQPLEDLVRRGPLELQRALRILSDITAGLAHAHSRGIIHRDLKPSNVFILPDGKVKLLDFGLARLASSLGVDLVRSGTPAFMAPEQWRGQPQDMRTDTWAAGLLLYEMLTGELPQPSGNLKELRAWVLSDEPVASVRTRRPDLPEQVDRFLTRALAKEPARRFQSALEMHERLRVLEWSLVPSAEAPPSRFIPHRRQVTLVCCRFSGNLGSFDAEDLSELQAAFHQACARVIERYGGWVAVRMGDEVLGCFGYPLAREDDVLDAVRAALALTRLAEELPRAAQTELAVHVGVHTDLVVLDMSPSSGTKGLSPSIQGEAPRLATWLAERAAPDTALLSDNTWQGARGNFVTTSLGPRTFYSSLGAVAVNVHQLVSERPETIRFERARVRGLTPLVDRTLELRQLLALWVGARQGRGVMVLLRGEAGIGKSRLVQELCAHALREGAPCVSCQCWPQFSRSAFHPVLGWVVQLLGLDPDAPAEARWTRLEEALKAFDMSTPEESQLLGQLLDLPAREGLPPLLLSPEQQRERTLETLVSLLLRLPARLPRAGGSGALLLVMEDLHWADPSTLRLLTLLAERIEMTKLCVVTSTRPELRHPWPHHPGFFQIMLERLGADETTEMVRRLTGHGPGLTDETLALLVRQTEGIPLFVEEMTRMVLTRARPDGAAPTVGSLPVTLQELLTALLDPLPQEQKELAWMGAVIGRSFTLEQLAVLSGREGPTLKRDLEELVEEGLLLHSGDEPEPGYAFRHALIQEAAYESLLKPRRRRYHHQIARLLEHPRQGTTTAPPELIAHHYTQAGELEPAIRFWTRAGELALHRSAFEESGGHLEQALQLLGRLPETPRRAEEELRLLVLLGQALSAARNYSAPEVKRIYARVTRIFHDVRNTPILVAASRGLFNQNMMRLNFPLALALAEQIVSLGERVHEPQLLVVGRLMAGMSQLVQGHVVEARKQFSEAVARGTEGGEREPPALGVLEPDPLAMAQAYEALTLTIRCHQQQGQRLIDAALRRAERLAHPYTLILICHAASTLYQARFDARRVLEMTDRENALFERYPLLRVEWWTPVKRGWALVWLGQKEEGHALLMDGLDRLRKVNAETGWPYFLCMLADARLRLGMISEGLEAVAEGLAWGHRTGQHLEDAELYRLRGELLLRQGDVARARSEFLHSLQRAREMGARCLELRTVLNLCHLLEEQGRSREAQQLLTEHLDPLPPGLDSPELRVARLVRARIQEAHAGEPDIDGLLAAAPWEAGHIYPTPTPTFLEPP